MKTSNRIAHVITTCMLATLLLAPVGTAQAKSTFPWSRPTQKIACGSKQIGNGVVDAVSACLDKIGDVSGLSWAWHRHRSETKICLAIATVVALYGAYRLGKRNGKKRGNR